MEGETHQSRIYFSRSHQYEIECMEATRRFPFLPQKGSNHNTQDVLPFSCTRKGSSWDFRSQAKNCSSNSINKTEDAYSLAIYCAALSIVQGKLLCQFDLKITYTGVGRVWTMNSIFQYLSLFRDDLEKFREFLYHSVIMVYNNSCNHGESTRQTLDQWTTQIWSRSGVSWLSSWNTRGGKRHLNNHMMFIIKELHFLKLPIQHR